MGQTINPFKKDIIKVETDFCGKKLSLEINRVGFRASASVIARYGDTVVLGTAMVGNRELKGFDYFPLSIDYEEKMYAAGKISGSRFIKREGRPSDDAILIGRLIDRPIRPLWPKGYRHEAQGVASVLSMDPDFRPDAIAMIAVSTAFMLTGAPFEGPVAGVRVGIDNNGDFTTFGTATELNEGKLDLFVAGADKAIMMVEAGANEVSETEVTKALQFAFDAMQPAIEIQKELVKKVGVTDQEYSLSLPSEDIQKEVNAYLDGKMGEKIRTDYPTRHEKMHELREAMLAHFEEKLGDEFDEVKSDYEEAFASAANKDVRKGILQDGLRPDGRGFEDIRQLSSEVGFLPRAHGSSLFTRGLTQGMNIVTLAPLSYSQIVDTMEFDKQRRYLHHYNAPGYTIGEVKRLMGPGRREIGHGYLAERALLPVIPSEEEFPYTIRTVTEIMSQHGSTSMAATCSSCLALMDAGVPIKNPVSGIAMGLMKEDDKVVILSDIADAEDFAGDMDFKVTGTKNGITALQMDMKVHGLGIDVLSKALEQGKVGRAKILEHMLTTIAEPRKELSTHAPRIDTITINPERIRDVIGKGGETINKIIAETGAEIDIKDDGTVMISSSDSESREKAVQWVKVLTEDPEVGKIYKDCRVVSILDFGIFVEILPGREGLVHVSELSEKRVEKVADFIKEGEKVTVKLVAIDEKGRLNLSIKAAKKEG